ncbi:HAD family hydrolase [Geobacillus stearothermophilus]|uniref:HAD family hydrolase n=1 Tax=Anoxybacillaceae TaxID=3120669 RepID=UPI0015FF9E72|nr:HAD hydrolase-like protein [Geobacillus stearothermophilus]
MKKHLSSLGIDFDGTILDSRFRHQKVLYDVLINLNFNINLEDLNDFVSYKSFGRTTEDYLKIKGFYDTKNILRQWVENIERNSYLNLDKLYPNAETFLNTLADRYNLYLVTARKNRHGLFQQLNNLGITKYFKDILVVNPGYSSAFEKTESTKKLGLEFVIGDTEVDWNWAKNINCEFFALNWGFRNKAWWEARNIISYQNLEEILSIIIRESVEQ